MTIPNRPALSHRVRPTLDTKFHIDYDWWKREGRDLHTYLLSHLQPEQREQIEHLKAETLIDWIDPVTAEVRRVDALQQGLMVAARDPHFISDRTTVVDAIFRVFLANGNEPLSPVELGRLINRPPATILRTVAGTQVYKGIRPLID